VERTVGFIETFFRKNPDEVTKDDIETLISRKIEENLNLDYKEIRKYFDMDGIAKHVSAFANSAGGLLILGVSEKQEKNEKGNDVKVFPEVITWGDETLTKEKLEDTLTAKIQPRIDGLRIQPVRQGNGSRRVIFVIDFPQSDNPPHMANYRYYKRLNFKTVPMEHYEVSDFFGRRRKPALSLLLQILEVTVQPKFPNVTQFRARFILKNKGKAIAKYTRLVAHFDNLEILGMTNPNFHRIDHLHKGKPCIQYDAEGLVYYPEPFDTEISDVTFRVLDDTFPIEIQYSLAAEDMEHVKNKIVFSASELKSASNKIQQGKVFLLASRE